MYLINNFMRIAILISGSPRFYKDFDTFINNLSGYSKVDWFFYLWDQNPRPDKLGYENQILVADSWRSINKDWAINKITSNLPLNQELVRLELGNADQVPYPEVPGPQDHHTNFPSICKMHYGWYKSDQLRQESGNEYDLVIRARPDLCLPSTLDLQYIKSIIDQDPSTVVVSTGGQHGHGYTINDTIAISSPKNMKIYTDLVNHSIEYNREGIVFHPETLLAFHLIKNNLRICPFINVEIRANTVNNPDGTMTLDFGRWE